VVDLETFLIQSQVVAAVSLQTDYM